MFERLLEVLNRKAPPVESGARTFATAFAELYQEAFFSHYYEQPYFATVSVDQERHPFEDIIFNATEFKTGIAFRFQKSITPCKIGNGNIWMDADQADELRMADVVSASSCIPGGFEPFQFPEDFHWPKTYQYGDKRGEAFGPVELKTGQGLDSGLALMDGGVYDNQGITSVLLAISRRVAEPQAGLDESENHDPQAWANWAHDLLGRFSIVDLFIVSDTPVLKETMYSVDYKTDKAPGRFAQWLSQRTLGDLNRFAWIVAIILLLSAVAAFVRLTQTGQLDELRKHLSQGIGGYLPLLYEGLATLVPLLTAGLLGAIMLTLRGKLNAAARDMRRKLPNFSRSPWYYLKHMRLYELASMLRLRASSLMALSSDIYMHRIRQLGYGILFSRKELIPSVMTNEIYAIRSAAKKLLPDSCEPPSADVRAIVELCSTMATKASFDKLSQSDVERGLTAGFGNVDTDRLVHREDGKLRSDLDLLTACGQISTCYNLIRHLRYKLDHLESNHASADALRALLDRAVNDWSQLQKTPFMYVDERLAKGRSAKHEQKLARIAARKAAVSA